MRVLFLLVLFCPQQLWAAAINHIYVEQNTQQTTTSASLVDVSGASIASANFTAGKKYLLYFTWYMASASAGIVVAVDILHGSTSFLDAQIESNTQIDFYLNHQWMTVWTAVSGEAVKFQFRSNGSATAKIDNIGMMAINLSDDVTENTDWFYNERTTDDALTTTPVDGASITFTPSGTSDWLVIPWTQIFATDNTSNVGSSLIRSGEASSSDPSWKVESSQTLDQRWSYAMPICFSLTSASNTFKEQSVASASSGTRLKSAIFALNLNKFRDHTCAYTAADSSALSTTNYNTQVQTLSITPTVASDVWILAYWGLDHGNAAAEGEQRIQVDNTDVPSDWSSDNRQIEGLSNDNTDEIPMGIQTMVSSMTAASHIVDLDVSVDAGAAATAQHRSLIAFTMELAATAVVSGGSMNLIGVGR